jgi:hypothetical protein
LELGKDLPQDVGAPEIDDRSLLGFGAIAIALNDTDVFVGGRTRRFRVDETLAHAAWLVFLVSNAPRGYYFFGESGPSPKSAGFGEVVPKASLSMLLIWI